MTKALTKPSHNSKFYAFVQILAARIQNLRKREGTSMEELAEKCGVTRGTIHKIEHPTASEDVSLATIWVISRIFGTNIESILQGIDKTIEAGTTDDFADASRSLEKADLLALSLVSELTALQIRADLSEQACLVVRDAQQLEILAEHSANLRQKRYALLLKQRDV